MSIIDENDKAIIIHIEGGGYEVWMKLFYTTGKKKGELITPTDEDFGVKAWCTYNIVKARKIFQEITDGTRSISPMTDDADFKNKPAK